MTIGFSYDLTDVTIAGLSAPTKARYEWTSNAVAAAYQQNLQVVVDYYNLTSAEVTALTPAEKAQKAADVSTAINNLLVLARDGISSPLDPNQPVSVSNPTKLYFLNVEMATNLDLLVRSFNAAGATGSVGGFTITADQLTNWKDLSALSSAIGDIIRVGVNTAPGNRSIQSLVELEYVGTANTVIEQQMSSLESALSTTKSVLDIMAAIQDLHNRITVSALNTFTFNYLDPDGNKENYQAYKVAASAYFGQAIVPKIPASWGTYDGTSYNVTQAGSDAINQLIAYRTSIANQIALLSQQFTLTQRNATGSLYLQLKSVYNDLQSVQAVAPGSVISQNPIDNPWAWFIDKYDKTLSSDVTQQGQIQSNITKAITAGQSLNDQQKEDVRNFLFVFEEYYKSASSILQKLTQLLERLAQGIKG